MHWRRGLAVLAGLALAAAFPQPGISGLAWLAPGLLMAAVLGETPARRFRLGYLAGVAHFLASLGWLLFIPFPVGAVAGWIALSLYLALFPATWTWLCGSLPGQPSADSPVGASLASTTVTARSLWCLQGAAGWVALEYLRGWLLSGFPWNTLGVSQYGLLPLVQLASVTGVLGISFLVAWASLALLCAATRVWFNLRAPSALAGHTPGFYPAVIPTVRRLTLAGLSDLLLPGVALGVVLVWGILRLVTPSPSDRTLTLALIQPSIPQRLIFDPRETTNRFNALMKLSRAAVAAKPDVLVWPEASLPGLTEERFQAITNLVASAKVWMILGADDFERRPDTTDESWFYYNIALLLSPEGHYAGSYRKRKLVIFGEYVPFGELLPFMNYLTPIDGSMTPGKTPGFFRLASPRATLALLICFEDTFANFVRRSLDDTTDILLNLTNNGWFGESSAQWQHTATASFRAVETGLPLVRCTNNGITCWIDPFGRWHNVGFEHPKDVYRAGVKLLRVPLPAQTGGQVTFYRRHGDWLPGLCLAGSLLGLGRRWRARKATPAA